MTFNSNGGTAIAPVTVVAGGSVGRPAEPTNGAKVFCGWYSDANFEHKYDFSAAVTADITLYAKWDGTVYKLTSTHNSSEAIDTYDKFIIQFKGSGQPTVNAGDVLSFRYRSSVDFTYFNIRGEKKWIYENSTATHGMTSFETKEDGWTYVTYVFAVTDYAGAVIPANTWFRIDFGSKAITTGDILEVQAITLNGEPLTLTASNIVEGVVPSFESVEGYDWSSHTVSFDIGYNDLTESSVVGYGRRVTAPTLGTRDGYLFIGWFSDSSKTEAFNFDTHITADTTVYVKWGARKTVTFDSKGGSSVPSVDVPAGTAVTQPTDPTKEGSVFDGWYIDDEYETPYNFSTTVVADITLYAKWLSSKQVTINLNYTGAPDPTVVEVETGTAMDQPKNPSRVGYFFGGWYDDAGGSTPHDFTAAVNSNTTIYAKWNAPSVAYKYEITDSNSSSRFRWRFKGSSVTLLSDIQPDDVITFMVKFNSTSPLNNWKVSIISPTEQSVGNQTFSSMTADANGWYSVTAVVPEGVSGNGLYVQWFTSNSTWNVGDICYIKGLAYNGDAIPLPGTGTSDGLYPGAKASVTEVNPTTLEPIEP